MPSCDAFSPLHVTDPTRPTQGNLVRLMTQQQEKDASQGGKGNAAGKAGPLQSQWPVLPRALSLLAGLGPAGSSVQQTSPQTLWRRPPSATCLSRPTDATEVCLLQLLGSHSVHSGRLRQSTPHTPKPALLPQGREAGWLEAAPLCQGQGNLSVLPAQPDKTVPVFTTTSSPGRGSVQTSLLKGPDTCDSGTRGEGQP